MRTPQAQSLGIAISFLCIAVSMAKADPTASKPATDGAIEQAGVPLLHWELRAAGGMRYTCDVSSDGQVISARQESPNTPPTIARGRLDDERMRRLRDAFAGWETLDAAYGDTQTTQHIVECIEFGGKRVCVGPPVDRPDVFQKAARAIRFIAIRHASVDVPDATVADLQVGVFRDEAGSTLFSFVTNISDHSVRIYAPGLSAPSFQRPQDQGTTAVIPGQTAPAMFGPGDFVILRPGDAFARKAQFRGELPKGTSGSAYYIVYKQGEEGDRNTAIDILYSHAPAPQPSR